VRDTDGSGPSGAVSPRPTRLRIERARRGFRVVGEGGLEGFVAYEPTLREALEWRADGPALAWSAPPLPASEAERSRPPERVVYGPVASRRLGRSLGVDLSPPGCRVCSFDCTYCEYAHLARSGRTLRWPTPKCVGDALASALADAGPLDSITVSGHGEPTLHPRFAAVVEALLGVARAARPGVPVRILTNGSGAERADVRAALQRLDERILKLDADAERVNRVASARLLLVGARALHDVTIQCCFVGGDGANTGAASVAAWLERVRALRPTAVQIYTIDRPAPSGAVRPAAPETLEEIACALRERTGIEARVFA
jgi:wyosine [tRNA(Phe)-imidazoG37] synthetase (radical SAM superfamily)